MKIIIKAFNGVILPFFSELDIPNQIDNPEIVELTYDLRLRQFDPQLVKLEWATNLDKYCIKAKALNAYRKSADGYLKFEKALEVGIDVTKYSNVETEMSLTGNLSVRRIVSFKPSNQRNAQEKPFIVANVKELLQQLDKEEITFSRMVEKMNEIAIEWSINNNDIKKQNEA